MLFEIYKSSDICPEEAPLKEAFEKEIVRPSGHKSNVWVVDVKDFNELFQMIDEQKAYFIMGSPKYNGGLPTIEIYDTWRE